MHKAHDRTLRTARAAANAVRALPPGVRSLLGILRDSRLDVADYREHLAEKYLTSNETPRSAPGESSPD
jgi:hypothetical protein